MVFCGHISMLWKLVGSLLWRLYTHRLFRGYFFNLWTSRLLRFLRIFSIDSRGNLSNHCCGDYFHDDDAVITFRYLWTSVFTNFFTDVFDRLLWNLAWSSLQRLFADVDYFLTEKHIEIIGNRHSIHGEGSCNEESVLQIDIRVNGNLHLNDNDAGKGYATYNRAGLHQRITI